MNLNNGNKVKNFFKNLWQFIALKTFLKHGIFAVIGGFLLLTLVFLSLNLVTHHGEGLSVPDFSGLNMKQVTELSDDKNLNYKIIDSVYNAPGKKGTVIAQIPPAGFKVKEDRTILLTVKTFNPQKILMPDFTGVSLIQAKADIETYGLKIGKLKYVPDIATNNVLDQMFEGRPIRAGTPIIKNSVIDLVLGMGKSDKITIVPDLTGMAINDAIQKATDLSLNIGAKVYDNTLTEEADSLSAIIWKQVPTRGTQITIGSAIDIWLSMNINKTDSK